MKIPAVHRRALTAIGAVCLVAAALTALPATAFAESPAVSAISDRGDSHPIPTQRPGKHAVPSEESEKEETSYYHSCAQARAEGRFWLLPGQPGYTPFLDRDGDGIACNE